MTPQPPLPKSATVLEQKKKKRQQKTPKIGILPH